MANLLLVKTNKKGVHLPEGIFTQKQKVWEYIEPDINEDFSMQIYPSTPKKYKVNKDTMGRLLKDNDGVVFRENGVVQYVVVHLEKNPEREDGNKDE